MTGIQIASDCTWRGEGRGGQGRGQDGRGGHRTGGLQLGRVRVGLGVGDNCLYREQSRVRWGGTYFHTHMHARQGCQACSLIWVASSLVVSERVVEQVAPEATCHKHIQLTSVHTTTPACGFPYPTLNGQFQFL